MSFVIKSITAFVAIDPKDGDEGVIGLPLPGDALSLPAIAADEQRAKELYPHVKRYCEAMGVEFRIIQLSTRTDITEEWIKNLS